MEGPLYRPWDFGGNFEISEISGTKNDASDVDEFWTIEGIINWDKIAEGKPKKGDRWAYNFMRVDYDDNNSPMYWVAKSTGKKNIHHPESWPVITF